MIYENPVTKEKGQSVVVGRATVGIFLVLDQIKRNDTVGRKKVLFPANVCYTAVLPSVFLGLEPVFLDVNKLSGLVEYKTMAKAVDEDVLAALVPHMYGNPVDEIQEIASLLSERNITLLEDCASLMAISGKTIKPGTYGDYVIYSTGYAKTISLGFGGLVFSSKHSLSEIEISEKELPVLPESSEDYWDIFSKNYRKYRNEGQCSDEAQAYFKTMRETARDNIIFSISDNKRTEIINAIDNLSHTIETRKNQYRLYQSMLKDTDYLSYPLGEDAVPWRYNLFVENKKEFIGYCLDRKLPISDWYPVVAPLFGDVSEYPNAKKHEEGIVNFPLVIDTEEIKRICEEIKRF